MRNCHTCSRAKLYRYIKYGILRPLPVSIRRWGNLSMDCVIGIPMSEGYNVIMVIINRLMKMRHFILTIIEVTAEDTANLFVNYVFKLYGFPNTIISDRGP